MKALTRLKRTENEAAAILYDVSYLLRTIDRIAVDVLTILPMFDPVTKAVER
jgi:hypothetical protein